ncbi:MAG: flavin reductase family protein [Pseudomonadota bacterium]
MTTAFDDRRFRDVLGTFTTGVVIVSTMLDGKPEGMTIGAFTSVSLDPPMVAFLPAKSSTTWPKIRSAGAFTINILARDQEALCRAFARTSDQKFDGVDWAQSEYGTPHVAGALSWLDCTLITVVDAGDHDIALGEVRALTLGTKNDPLVFFGGAFRVLEASRHATETTPDHSGMSR